MHEIVHPKTEARCILLGTGQVVCMGYLERLPGVDDGNTTRRNATVSAAYILAGLAAVDVVTDDTESDAPEPQESAELQTISRHTEWLQNSASFDGSGQTVTDTFDAVRFTTFVYEYDGPSGFQIELVDAETEETETGVLEEDGPVSGAVGIGLPNGRYALDIDADGDWQIEAGEPAAPEDGRNRPPATIEGDGSNVFGKVIVSDAVTVRGQHTGESDFVVNAWDEANTEGTPNERLFAEVGEFEGETTLDSSGLYYITVEADGAYQIEIE